MECYAFEYFRSGETEIFVPRNLTPMEKGRDQPEPLSQRHFLRMKFWEDMLRRLGDRVPHRRKPTKERWLSFGIGIGGVDVHWSGAKSELRVNLFVNKERHPTLVNKLRDFLPALLKRETGEEWSVHETPKEFYVRVSRYAGTWVWKAPEEVRNWGVEMLVKLYNVIVPELRKWARESDEEESKER